MLISSIILRAQISLLHLCGGFLNPYPEIRNPKFGLKLAFNCVILKKIPFIPPFPFGERAGVESEV
jgi:hypothetical protein